MDEEKRLLDLLKSHKINQDEYEQLKYAIYAKNGVFARKANYLLNPFSFIPTNIRIILAVVIIVCTSLLAWYGQFHFHGLLDHEELTIGKHISLLIIFIEILLPLLLFSLISWGMGLLLNAKHIRFVDFMIYSSLAKFPYLLLAICLVIFKHLDYNLYIYAGDNSGLHHPLGYIWMVMFYILYCWQICLLFAAVKESSGLKGTRLWSTFITSVIVVEVISIDIFSVFFYSYIY